MKKITVSLLAVIVLAACAGDPPADIQGEWALASFGTATEQSAVSPMVETSILFDTDGQMSGNVGCNGFGGEYEVNGDTITFGPVMSTEMYCEAVADQEAGTFAVLQGKVTFVLDGDTLTLTSADGNSSIVLERK